MEKLKDLQKLATLASDRFNLYSGLDFVLPQIFKDKVTEINSNSIVYNKYSAIIETKGNQHGKLNIFLPNQWFYIASYFTELYNELQRYKKFALQITTKERLKDLDGKKLNDNENSSLNSLGIDDSSKAFLKKFITDYKWWGGGKTIDRGDFFVSPILNCAGLVNASQTFITDLCAFLADKQELVKAILEKGETDNVNVITYKNTIEESFIDSSFRPYLAALKSKPFLLLAGISGTGKSRIVRELARACWDTDSDEYRKQKPRNFEMVQVKPNWHDSYELFGYVSRVSGKPVFVVGDFLRFVARAWAEPEIPYFLCLDEMNLAPVEQYFAEFLSVIESRKCNNGVVTTDPILRKDDTEWFFDLTASIAPNEEVRERFKNEGICLPQNLIVVGTVNMDETTFSFSRKVLDRAMTIEMNEVDLHGGLSSRHERIGKLGAAELIGTAVEGVDVYEANKEVCDIALNYLQAVNDVLNGTPFKIAYRTRNEFLLYVVNNLPYNKDAEGNELPQGFVIARALDEITNMKILSRIEGDETKVSDRLLNALRDTISNGLKDITDEEHPIKSISIAKLSEMQSRLSSSGYTNFWS